MRVQDGTYAPSLELHLLKMVAVGATLRITQMNDLGPVHRSSPAVWNVLV